MEQINRSRSGGLSGNALRTWGFLFIILGTAGMSVIHNGLLGLGNMDAAQMLEAMEGSKNVMGLVSAALVLRAVESCAVPLFAFLLVEGFLHTSDWKMYLTRIGVVALLSELPYNLAMGGSLWVTDSRNPVFGLALALVMLYFYQRFGNLFLKIAITAAGVLWCEILKIDYGAFTVLLVASMWGMRKRPQYRLFVGCGVAVACCLISPFYLASPMSFLAIHGYNGEPGERNRVLNYLAYPVILLVFGILGKLI